MVIAKFPAVEQADQYGLLALGGDLELESLLKAYKSGIFPWPFSEEYPAWFAPPMRALLFLNEFNPSRSLLKEARKAKWSFAINANFTEVIKNCSLSPHRKGQAGTWITEAMIEAYTTLKEAGYAFSIEALNNGKLAGGLYGVSIAGMFAGESMFYLEPNASKLCMLFLVEKLKSQGFEWIDCQVLTPFLASLGAREIERSEFMLLLEKALSKAIVFRALPA